VSPERLAVEHEDRDAEHVIGCRLFLGGGIFTGAFAREKAAILFRRDTVLRDHRRHGVWLVDLELALEEALVDRSAEFAELAVTGKPGTLQIRLADPLTNNLREGLGACTGDSGAPAFEMQAGRAVVIGVVSWSTGASNSDGCGGLTGVTPLALYRDWILRTARSWGAAL